MASCYYCNTPLPHGQRIYRTSVCPNCGKPLKICLNCEFYSPSSHFQCREDIGEQVREKDMPNFCEYFSPRRGSGTNEDNAGHEKAIKKFNDLFSD